MPRLIQLQRGEVRRVALVEEPELRLLADVDSVFTLANIAVRNGTPLTTLIAQRVTRESLPYDPIYQGESPWRLLPPIDHPVEPARCLISGTGLTHLGSATNRNAMHGMSESQLTDSMRMFRSGLEGGRPSPGRSGTPPEWFYKGPGTVLRAHGQTLVVPPYAGDGGEEAEIAGVYLIDLTGQPRRIGMAAGNEFSDHRFEQTNYLNLAGSKLRTCALGPELAVDPEFHTVPGKVTIERAGRISWTKDIATGETEMCHSLANIEHHHFKFEAHRRSGDVHVHFFGAPSLSFGEDVQLADGDVMVIQFDGFGRALRNPMSIARPSDRPIAVQPL